MLMKIDDKPFFQLMEDYHFYQWDYYCRLIHHILGDEYLYIDENLQIDPAIPYIDILRADARHHDDMMFEYDDILYHIEYGLERGISQDES